MVVPFSIPYNLLLSQYLQHNAKERIEDTTCNAKKKKKNRKQILIFLQRKNIKKHPLYHYKGCPLMKKKISFCKYLTAL